MPNSSRKPSSQVMNIFAYGGIGFVLIINLENNFFAYFLTDVMMIPAAFAGSIMLISRLSDSFAAIIAGGISEHYSFRWGKYGSWLIIGPPIAVIFFALMYTNYRSFGWGLIPTSAVLIISYFISHLFANTAWSAHYALLPVVGNEENTRSLLSAKLAQMMALGGAFVGIISLPLINLLGAGNEAQGYFLTAVVMALLMWVGYLAVYKNVKPWIKDINYETKETTSIADMWEAVKGNKNVIILLTAYGMYLSSLFSLLGFGPYYFNYVVQRPMLVSLFIALVSFASFVGASISGYLYSSIIFFNKKKNIFIFGALLSIIPLILAFFIGFKNVWIFIICTTIYGIGRGILTGQIPALFADTSEYSEWKTGKGARGIIMGSIQNLSPKIGVALSGSIVGFGLSIIGYKAGTVVSSEIVQNIHRLTTLTPVIFILLTIGIILFYNLSEEEVIEMRKDIKRKKGDDIDEKIWEI